MVNLVGWTVVLLALLMVVRKEALLAVQKAALPVVRQSYPRKHRLDAHLSLEPLPTIVHMGPHLPCQRRCPIEGSHFNQLAKWVARQSDS